MKWYQRIELWILAILVLGGLVWVLGTRPEKDAEFADTVTDSPPERALKIHRCVLERDYGNARLDIELRCPNPGTEPLLLQPPAVRLVTASGREAPPFFLPFETPPTIAEESTQDVRLRYWLEKKDLEGALTLELGKEKVQVKSATPLDLEKLENKKPKAFEGVEWSL